MIKKRDKLGRILGKAKKLYTCKECKKRFRNYRSNNRIFCSKKCYAEALKKHPLPQGFQKGHPNYLKHHTEEAKRKISIKHKGKLKPKHTEEWKQKMRGKIPWNKGLTEETDKRISKYVNKRRNGGLVKCSMCDSEFYVSGCRKNIAQFCSYKCYWKNRIGNYNVGEKSHLWKGGITPLYNQIRCCSQNKKWIKDIFKQDNYTCWICKDNRGGNLNAHHIKGFSSIIKENKIKTLINAIECKELWDINNGITLCDFCHKIYTNNCNKQIK